MKMKLSVFHSPLAWKDYNFQDTIISRDEKSEFLGVLLKANFSLVDIIALGFIWWMRIYRTTENASWVTYFSVQAFYCSLLEDLSLTTDERETAFDE